MKHSRDETISQDRPTAATVVGRDVDPAVIDALAERLEGAFSAFSKRIAGACGSASSTLTPAQFHLLAALAQTPGGMRVTDLAELGGVQPSAITAIVDRLVERGLLSRERDPRDRRAVLVAATDAGRSELDCSNQAVRDYLRPILGQLEPEELADFFRVLDKLERIAGLIEEEPGSAR